MTENAIEEALEAIEGAREGLRAFFGDVEAIVVSGAEV